MYNTTFFDFCFHGSRIFWVVSRFNYTRLLVSSFLQSKYETSNNVELYIKSIKRVNTVYSKNMYNDINNCNEDCFLVNICSEIQSTLYVDRGLFGRGEGGDVGRCPPPWFLNTPLSVDIYKMLERRVV